MVRKRHMWWRYLLFTLLGIFIGVGSVGVGVVAAGFSIRGNDIERWTGQDIFTDEFQDKNIIDLITTIAMNENNDLDTLGGIAKISPLVDQLVDNINEMFQKQIGYSWPKEEMYTIKFDKLGDWMVENLKNNASVAAMINAGPESNAIMKLVLFPKDSSTGDYDYDHAYTLGDFMTPGFFDKIIDSMVLRDVLGQIDPDNALLNAIGDWGINDLKNQDKLFGLKINQLLGNIDESNSLLYAIQDWDINKLKDGNSIYTLTISQLMGNIDPDNSLLNAIKDWDINKLKDGDSIYTLTIQQLMGTIDPSNNLLNAIKDWDINKLKDGTSVYELTIEQLMGTIDPENKLLYSIRNWTINDLKDKDKIYDELTVSDLVSNITEENHVLWAIKDWTIRKLMADDSFNSLTIEQLVGPVSEDNHALYAIKGWTISELTDENKFNSLTIEDLLGTVDEDNHILYALRDLSISDLSDSDKITARIDTLSLEDVFGTIDEENKVLSALKGLTIGELKDKDVVMAEINKLTVSELFGDIDPENKVLYAFKDTTIEDFKDKDYLTNKINTLKLEDVIGEIPEDNAFLNAIKLRGWTIGDLKDTDNINSLTIRDVLGNTKVSSSKILTAIADIEIGNLADEIDSLPLSDFIDTSGNKILGLVADEPINNIANAVNDLTFAQIIDEDSLDGNTALYNYLSTYTIGQIDEAFKNMTIGAIITDDTGIFKHLDKDRNISELGQAVKEMKIVDAFEDEIFNDIDTIQDRDECTIKAVWKFMLTPEDVEITPNDVLFKNDPNKAYYESYTVDTGMGSMVSNFEAHTKKESIRTLYNAGLLTVDEGFLATTIPDAGKLALIAAGVDLTGKETYGDLNVNEITIVLNAVTQLIP